MNPTIDHDIPIPLNGKWKVLALKLGPGDSVRVDTNRQRCSLMWALKRQNMQGTSRKVNGTGFRVWRTT